MSQKQSPLQKLIIPTLLLAIVGILFFNYLMPSDKLGDFSQLDPNSHASVEIIVKYVAEKGIQRSGEGITFYVADVKNKEVLITGLTKVPPGMSEAPSIILVGHMSGRTAFHAHSIELRN